MAVQNGWRLRRRTLNELEIPTALLSSLFANSNRDPKKQKKGFTYKDFVFYSDPDDEDRPDARYGTAAVELVKAGKFPDWSLFCFSALRESADPNYTPTILAFVAEDAILLAPTKSETGWNGLLIARESASQKSRVFTADDGSTIKLTLPYIETKVIAREGITLY